MLYTGEYESSEESLIVEEMEKLSIEAEGAREGEKESKEVEKTPDVRFEAYIMQNQRILETDDDIVRFHDQPPDASSDSPCTSQTPKGAEGGIQGGGWQFQNLSHVKKRIKQIIRRELNRQDAMSEEEVAKVGCMPNGMVVLFHSLVVTVNFGSPVSFQHI